MLKEKLNLVPLKPGCYLMKDINDNIIYVGKAKKLKKRLSSYFNKVQSGKTKALVSNIVDFEYIVTNTEAESLILEMNLIKQYSPKYNILLKDDKTYPYIVLENNGGPVLKLKRTKDRKKLKGKVFGPFPNVLNAKKTIELLNRIYPLKKCDNKKKLCLYYHIDECLGYCEKNISSSIIKKMEEEVCSILNGNYKLIEQKILKLMEEEASKLNFEKAIELKESLNSVESILDKQIVVSSANYNFDVFGYYSQDDFVSFETLIVRDGVIVDRKSKIIEGLFDEDIYLRYLLNFYNSYSLPKEIIINDISSISLLDELLEAKFRVPKKGDAKKILDMANNNSKISLKSQIEILKLNSKNKEDALLELKKITGLDDLSRIELYDNSHLFGTYYVGTMVVFDEFKKQPKEYRKYKIDSKVKDDLNAMREVIYRRVYNALINNTELPNLIILDGGQLQINAVKEILNDLNVDIKLLGLVKDEKHRTSKLLNSSFEIIEIKSNLLLFLKNMQDEVHRFAITYHRDIKSKGMLSSLLDNVSGLGETRKKKLLKKYSSLDKIKKLSISELSEILPKKVAEDLYYFLKEYRN